MAEENGQEIELYRGKRGAQRSSRLMYALLSALLACLLCLPWFQYAAPKRRSFGTAHSVLVVLYPHALLVRTYT